MVKRDDSLFNGWFMNSSASEKFSELNEDLRADKGLCVDVTPSPWIDYGGEDEPFAEPSAIDAVMMCSGCPVVESCFAYAKASKQVHGVWGGVKFRNGKERRS
jgi:hypothetical protein